MNLDDLGDFPRSPLILVITQRGQKTLFCVFLRFRDLYGLKLTGDFSRINIFQNMTIRDFETKQTEPGGGISTRWRAHPLGAPLGGLGLLGPSRPPSKLYGGFRDLKPPYIKVSEASRDGGAA